MILLGILTVYYLIIHHISKTTEKETALAIQTIDNDESIIV